MKIAKKAMEIIGYSLTIYIAVFGIWVLFGASCLSYVSQHNWSDSECNQNLMSEVIGKTHSPLIKLITN
jgi:hypothetical protein